MKNLVNKLVNFSAIAFLLLLTTTSSVGQSGPCDPCTAPWGAIQQKVYTGQTVQGLPPNCTFDIYLEIRTRVCNGVVQVKLVSYNLVSNNGCPIHCTHAWYLMRKATKLLLQDLGGHIVVSKPSSCYYTLDFELTSSLAACVGNEANTVKRWTAVFPCGTSCCRTEYILNGGTVETLNSFAEPCMGSIPNPLPQFITVYCYVGGVRTPFQVPVLPPTGPLTCENVCDNSGDIFSARPTSIRGEVLEQHKLVYPNPSGGIIHISDWNDWAVAKVYNMAGALVLETRIAEQQINIGSLPSANYKMVLVSLQGNMRVHNITKD